MGVLNVTPDSFSDGGEWFAHDAAVARGRELIAQGAAIVDVGGESTRPGAAPVGEAEELARVVPVVEALAGAAAQVSVDTSKAAVARAALAAGATYVNDVTALRGDPAMAELVAQAGCDVCLMHMLGEPRTMQDEPRYDDVVADVKAFLEERMAAAVAAGIAEDRIAVDPGIGFRQDPRAQPRAAAAPGRDRRAGPAGRRRHVAQVVPGPHHRARRPAPAGDGNGGDQRARLRARGRIFRVHDVAATRDALAVAAATLRSP